jgi:hypothetical protein
MILCRNAEGGTIYSAHLGTSTQSVNLNTAGGCSIPPNQNSCFVPLTWETINPKVTTNLTIGGVEVANGNDGDGVTITGLGSKTINFNNKVDGEGGTATNPASPSDNLMEIRGVATSCQQGANGAWTTEWKNGVCYNASPAVDAGSSVTLTNANPG